MAVINLAITIPDAQVPRFVAAARDAWGPNEDLSPKTQAQLVEELRARTKQALVDMVKRYEQEAAKTTAVVGVTEISAT